MQLGQFNWQRPQRRRTAIDPSTFWGREATAGRPGNYVMMESMAARRARAAQGSMSPTPASGTGFRMATPASGPGFRMATPGGGVGFRMAALSGYEYDPQLGGFFKSLKKIVKKVAAPIAHIGAAVLTGGASLAVSAKILADKKAKKMQEQQRAADAAEFDRQTKVLQQVSQAQPPSAAVVQSAMRTVAPAASPVGPVSTIAPTQAAVQQAVSQAQQAASPMFITIPSSAPAYDAPFTEASAKPAMPAWVIPAGIGAVGLIAVVALSAKGRR
jgi:hypothetical protein